MVLGAEGAWAKKERGRGEEGRERQGWGYI